MRWEAGPDGTRGTTCKMGDENEASSRTMSGLEMRGQHDHLPLWRNIKDETVQIEEDGQSDGDGDEGGETPNGETPCRGSIWDNDCRR